MCEAYEHERGLSAACGEIFAEMLDSRQAQRSAAGFSRRFAEAALTRLALVI
ncbi:hypothetical protein [Nannocystis pusilla]|uniref:hypothetical protein n=1 Tax=Nannocystis pusilla TaxID=889268 RepID=UPI003DA2F3F0